MLVADVRAPRDGTPLRKFDAKPGFFLVADESKIINVSLQTHPDTRCLSFKLKQMSCGTCGADLGNVQATSVMSGRWTENVGRTVSHFKCATVCLELTDCSSKFLEASKWSVLAKALGGHDEYRMNQLTIRHVTDLLQTKLGNSGKDVRLVAA